GHAAMWRPLGEGAQSQLCAACDVINTYARQHLADAVTMSALGHERTWRHVRAMSALPQKRTLIVLTTSAVL
ncbi:MAG: hypothetical protein WCB50_23800, partial [Pseudolabrys sp.]